MCVCTPLNAGWVYSSADMLCGGQWIWQCGGGMGERVGYSVAELSKLHTICCVGRHSSCACVCTHTHMCDYTLHHIIFVLYCLDLTQPIEPLIARLVVNIYMLCMCLAVGSLKFLPTFLVSFYIYPKASIIILCVQIFTGLKIVDLAGINLSAFLQLLVLYK